MKRKVILTMLLLLASLLALGGCAVGVSQEEYHKVTSDLSAAEAQIRTLQSDLSAAEAQIRTLQSDLSAAQAQIKTLPLKVIREAADTHLSSDKAPNISAEELFARLTDDNPENDPFILSVRSREHYAKGHIHGAINIPWREVAKEESLAKLPKNRQIVVYCYTGHTASQIAALLSVLGYDAVNLKFGMTSWTLDRDIAPGRYEEAQHCKNYPIVRGTKPEGAQEIPCG